MQLNIAIVGLISQGKSTLLNALLMDTFAKTEHKRSTMLPQVYVSGGSPLSAEEIFRKNDEANAVAEAKVAAKKFNREDRVEIFHHVDIIDPMLRCPDDVTLAIYDIPGVNDATTAAYHQYLADKIESFDIILYVLDIHGALNTTDDSMLLSVMSKMRGASVLIFIVNKCDTMVMNSEGEPSFDDQELTDCYIQIKRILAEKIKRAYAIVPMSSIDAFVYRTLHRDPHAKIELKFIDKMIASEMGSSKCKRMSEEEKRKKAAELISECNYDDQLIACGMREFEILISSAMREWAALIEDKLMVQLEREPAAKIGERVAYMHMLNERYIRHFKTIKWCYKKAIAQLLHEKVVAGAIAGFAAFAGKTGAAGASHPPRELSAFNAMVPLPKPAKEDSVKYFTTLFALIMDVYRWLELPISEDMPRIRQQLIKANSYLELYAVEQLHDGRLTQSYAEIVMSYVDMGIWSREELFLNSLLKDEVDWLRVDPALPILLRNETPETVLTIAMRKKNSPSIPSSGAHPLQDRV